MNLLTVITNLSEQDRQSRKGVFYDPKTSTDDTFFTVEAIVANHQEQSQGYLLFCDCSRLGDGSPSEQIERHSH